MQVKSIAEGKHSAIFLTFIKLPFDIKLFVLSIFEWPFYTGFTVISNFFLENKPVNDETKCLPRTALAVT